MSVEILAITDKLSKQLESSLVDALNEFSLKYDLASKYFLKEDHSLDVNEISWDWGWKPDYGDPADIDEWLQKENVFINGFMNVSLSFYGKLIGIKIFRSWNHFITEKQYQDKVRTLIFFLCRFLKTDYCVFFSDDTWQLDFDPNDGMEDGLSVQEILDKLSSTWGKPAPELTEKYMINLENWDGYYIDHFEDLRKKYGKMR